jgi:hypothetical protein
MREFLKRSQPVEHGSLALVGAGRRHAADPMILDVVPDLLVGVELRRVGGQEKQTQPAFGGVDELFIFD